MLPRGALWAQRTAQGTLVPTGPTKGPWPADLGEESPLDSNSPRWNPSHRGVRVQVGLPPPWYAPTSKPGVGAVGGTVRKLPGPSRTILGHSGTFRDGFGTFRTLLEHFQDLLGPFSDVPELSG